MQADLGEAREVLRSGVQHPLDIADDVLDRAEIGAGDRVDEVRARAVTTDLNQVGAVGVAVARGALGVDRDRPGPGGECRARLGEALVGLGVTLLTIGVNGPDYDLTAAEALVRWRDGRGG